MKRPNPRALSDFERACDELFDEWLGRWRGGAAVGAPAGALVTDRGEELLRPGMCAGFAAEGVAHHLVNRSAADVVFLEIGDRSRGDSADYPSDDLAVKMHADGKWVFSHKDGSPY